MLLVYDFNVKQKNRSILMTNNLYFLAILCVFLFALFVTFVARILGNAEEKNHKI